MSCWVAGVIVLIAGTFLPWVNSGRVGKSSYSITGSLERHLNLPSWAELLVGGWPFLGPLCAAFVVLFSLGLRRTAAALSLVVFLLVGLFSGALFFFGDGQAGPISIATLGPAVTVAGTLVALVGAILLLLPNPQLPTTSRSRRSEMR